ncbi:hypothetical protein PENTCL1PPCAC_1760, partial [Pristionchus entomophagus]
NAAGTDPILDPSTAANLGSQETNEVEPSTFDFQYMKCVDGNWMVYMPDAGPFLAQNPADCATSDEGCFMYNDIFCVQVDRPPPSKLIYPLGTRKSA